MFTMTLHQEQQTQQQSSSSARHRHALFVAVACSLLAQGATASSSSSITPTTTTTTTARRWNSQPLAFAATTKKPEKSGQKRERNSKVRLFSRGPDTQLSSSASSLSYTTTVEEFQYFAGSSSGADAATMDPFDPEFRPFSFSSTTTATASSSSRTVDIMDDLIGWGPMPAPPIAVTPTDTTAAVRTKDSTSKFRIFCDLDGVLVDFEAGVQKICRQSTAELAKTTMWQKIAQSNTAFFEHLPWTPDGPRLWQAIRHLNPDILTGVPDLKGSRLEKVNWCRRHLGIEEYRHVDMAGHGYNHANVNGVPPACPKQTPSVTNIITCWSYNKHHESGRHAVLIDDRIALKESWEAKGGIFVHHTNTESTLRKLREIGVLEDPNDTTTNISTRSKVLRRLNRFMP